MRHVIRTAAVALAAALPAAGVAQQGLAPFGTDNRAQALGELTDEKVLETLRSEGTVAMSGAFFETDSAELSESSDQVLFKLSSAMKQMPETRLAVIGHTDSTGSFEYNVELSARRAQAVVDALAAEPNGIARERMVAMGAGPISPVASNASEEGRALNRRVTFVVIE